MHRSRVSLPKVIVARLLVSVRSAIEALAATRGGAAIVDVKEPDRGPLGRADPAVWHAVRRVVPADLPVSVALGELGEHEGSELLDRASFSGIAYRKVGLAGASASWREDWTALRRRLGQHPPWILVVYADWKLARAPEPDAILETALNSCDSAGILVDTWDKSKPGPVDLSWKPWFDRARRGGLLTVLAGRLDAERIGQLAPLAPDVFAVRGAACRDGDRYSPIDPERVAALVRAANQSEETDEYTFSRTHVPVSLAKKYGKATLISRSQAKRVLARFDKFREVLLDFKGVESVGQSFADEIFRVFAKQNPDISIIALNANRDVQQMINRAKGENVDQPSDRK